MALMEACEITVLYKKAKASFRGFSSLHAESARAGCFFRYLGTKTFAFSSKNWDFLPKIDQIWPEIGIFGHFGQGLADSFGALLVGWLLVMARGLYIARHLFTLFVCTGKDFFLRDTVLTLPDLKSDI